VKATPPPPDWSALFPDGEQRLAAFIVRLPWQLPINDGSSFMFILDGDLGASWDFETQVRPIASPHEFVDGAGRPLVQNWRVPVVSVRVWQVPREQTLAHLVEPLSTVADHVYGRARRPAEAKSRPAHKTYETVVELVTQAAAADADRSAAQHRTCWPTLWPRPSWPSCPTSSSLHPSPRRTSLQVRLGFFSW